MAQENKDPLHYSSGPNTGKPIPGFNAWRKNQQQQDTATWSNYRKEIKAGTGGEYGSRAEAKFGAFMNNKTNSFLNTKVAQGAMSGIGSALDIASGFIKTSEEKGNNPTGYETQQKIGNAMTKIPIPIVQAAGLAYKGVSMLAEATGTNVNKITKDQANELGIKPGARLLNNIVGTLSPGIALWDEMKKGEKSPVIDEMTSAYSDTVSDIDRSQTLGGGKYIFGNKKIRESIDRTNRQNDLMTDINLTNTQRKQSNYAQDLAQQNLNRYQGTNYMDMRVGRKGMKIQSLEEIRELLKSKVVEELDVQKFADGGSILPVGQRHKTLHHMDELGEQFEDLTRKGIPVVTVDESGDMVQIAEIECMEWTLSKSLTDEIEALWRDGSEEAMIECGKLVCEHLLRQTKDEGGILNE